MREGVDFTTKIEHVERLIEKEEYTDSATRCVLVIEQALRHIINQQIQNGNDELNRRILTAVRKRDRRGSGIDGLTMGQIVHVFRESTFFEVWARRSQKDLSSLHIIDLTKLTTLRNKFAHHGQMASRTEAEFLLHCLKILLEIFDILKPENLRQHANLPPSSELPRPHSPSPVFVQKRGIMKLSTLKKHRFLLIGLLLLILISSSFVYRHATQGPLESESHDVVTPKKDEKALSYPIVAPETTTDSEPPAVTISIPAVTTPLTRSPSPKIPSEFRINHISLHTKEGGRIEPVAGVYTLQQNESVTIEVDVVGVNNHDIGIIWTANEGKILSISDSPTVNTYTPQHVGSDYVLIFVRDKTTGERLQKAINITVIP